ncbi:MAG: NtaA/DmoA family FMN-dependent monooxygenase [Herbiconiux sp.]|nr:NtaA/DmoA family FMN-dependent monooxygenase [Herbiconiux sp.]
MTGRARDADRGRADGRMLLGLAVRTLGSFPSGWRHPGAHHDPADDPAALRRLAKEAERAHLDYLFFGDRLATDLDLERTDPSQLGRTDPLSTVSHLAAVTRRIGLVATVNTSYSDPATVARAAASIDRLSGGRLGLNLAVGTEPGADANHRPTAPDDGRHDVAEEYLEVLTGLWRSWGDGAVVADQRSGVLIDRRQVSALHHRGPRFAVAGPALVPRPPQGRVPVVHTDRSPRARMFAARNAELLLSAPATMEEGVETVRRARLAVATEGREPGDLRVVASLFPIVAERREDAWALYDRLVQLVTVVSLEPGEAGSAEIRRVLGVPLLDRGLDDSVPPGDAARFNSTGQRLLAVVRSRSGRTPGGARPVDYRHLLVAHRVPTPLVVGSALDVADHVETWFRAGAADGFTVQSAFLHEQVEAFTRGVVPLLEQRGLLGAGTGSRPGSRTLRGRLGTRPPAREPRAPQPATAVSAFDGVIGLYP